MTRTPVQGWASLIVVVLVLGGVQMMMLGILMMVIYTYLYFVPWQRFRRTVSRADWLAAEMHIRHIRLLVGSNLVLGFATVVIGASGRYYG